MTYETGLAALADPTRRRLFEQIARAPSSVGELAAAVPVSQPAVSQHLRVLLEARLVAARREGRRRIYRVESEGLGEVRRWVESMWDAALPAFERYARERAEEMNP